MEKVKRTPAKLSDLAREFELEILVMAPDFETRTIGISDVNRPALQLVGYYDYFDPRRLQVLGRTEMTFLTSMSLEERVNVFDKLLSYDLPAIIVSRNLEVFPELIATAKEKGRTLMCTKIPTVDLTSGIIGYLNRKLAPQIMRHGVLMNVNGQGVLLLGESGIGKSETAIELLKRGHRLVADDAVQIFRVGGGLIGDAPEMIRHYMEIRGIGIIDIKQLFGMGAVQYSTDIDLVIEFEPWQDGKFYDRLGLGEETYTMLGVSLPYMLVPVRPGRNLAGIVEIATMKNRQMTYGDNPAEAFINRLDAKVDQMMEEAKDGAK
ncbi:MAG: HPr(Ser) kinase/phosphatase [Ruminococcaceae bacterium]|nr:HPr(Ser) kinase/phosphatase [Oscillospiraceae bacterium]